MVKVLVRPSSQGLPEEIDLGRFELIVKGKEKSAADRLASVVLLSVLKRAFRRQSLVLAVLYELRLEEHDVHYSNRKSSVTAKLVRRTATVANVMLFAFNFFSADYKIVSQNYETAQVFAQEKFDAAKEYVQEIIDDIEINPEDTGTPWRDHGPIKTRRQDEDEEDD